MTAAIMAVQGLTSSFRSGGLWRHEGRTGYEPRSNPENDKTDILRHSKTLLLPCLFTSTSTTMIDSLTVPRNLFALACLLICVAGVEAFRARETNGPSTVATNLSATRSRIIKPSRTHALDAALLASSSSDNPNDFEQDNNRISRRSLISSALTSASAASLVVSSATPQPANAAPPIAIMMEEMGYFPVQNRAGDTVYVPGRVRRESTPQAVELAKYLSSQNINLYAAYWCPHCRNQREMFGREALQYINYVECSPKGYGYDAKLCKAADLEGFPTWKIGSKKEIGSGEMTLEALAKATGYKGKFDGSLEEPLPMSGGSCQ